MITLNLVSLEQKKEIKLKHIYGFVKNINLALIIITIIIAIIFLIAKLILLQKFNEIVSQTAQVIRSSQVNNNVRKINGKLNYIAKIQNDFIPWSDLIKDLTEITPSDVKFYSVRLDANEQKIKIKGRAVLRESLLTFKDKMAASPYYKDMEFPIKNILEKENIDFEIIAGLNISNLPD